MIADQLNTYHFGYESSEKYIKDRLEREIADMTLSMCLAVDRNNLAAADIIGEAIFFYKQVLKSLNQEGVNEYVGRINSAMRTVQT